MIRSYVAMQEMRPKTCPVAIPEKTGEQVFPVRHTLSDKRNLCPIKVDGENAKDGGFKTGIMYIERFRWEAFHINY